MKFTVRVKPNARKDQVLQLEGSILQVSVMAPAVEGKANKRMLEVLAEYFDVPKRAVSIHSGHNSKLKIVSIEGVERSLSKG